MSKSIGENLSGKYSQKLLDQSKQSPTDAIKLLQKAEGTGDLIGNEMAAQITEVSKPLPRNNSKATINKHNKKIPIERYISSEENY